MSEANEGRLRRLVSWRWWNERVIEVPEHYYDWYAPRWYILVVVTAYIAMVIAFGKALVVVLTS